MAAINGSDNWKIAAINGRCFGCRISSLQWLLCVLTSNTRWENGWSSDLLIRGNLQMQRKIVLAGNFFARVLLLWELNVWQYSYLGGLSTSTRKGCHVLRSSMISKVRCDWQKHLRQSARSFNLFLIALIPRKISKRSLLIRSSCTDDENHCGVLEHKSEMR